MRRAYRGRRGQDIEGFQAVCRDLKFYPMSSGKQLKNCKQELNLVAL